MSAQSWFNRIWYSGQAPPWWLVPPSVLFSLVSGVRRRLYAHRLIPGRRLPCPVIVVGNLSVGGTGKTPLVCWLVEQLRTMGLRPGIVTRGYGGSEREPQIIDAAADPQLFGDESVFLAQRSAVPVAVGRDRPAAAQLLIQAACDVVISDDGMQHYALRRDCEIIVIDGDRRFGNGWLLPAGPLREPISRLDLANAVVVNGGRPLSDHAIAMRVHGDTAVSINSGMRRELSKFAGHCVHAIAGIGNPDRFFNMLRAYGIEVIGHALDDHAMPQRAQVVFADDKPVLMTDKDAVKCRNMADARHWVVPVDAVFTPQDAGALLAIVHQCLENRVG
jgi:tetraacyldisaccharide 4'-kinase